MWLGILRCQKDGGIYHRGCERVLGDTPASVRIPMYGKHEKGCGAERSTVSSCIGYIMVCQFSIVAGIYVRRFVPEHFRSMVCLEL